MLYLYSLTVSIIISGFVLPFDWFLDSIVLYLYIIEYIILYFIILDLPKDLKYLKLCLIATFIAAFFISVYTLIRIYNIWGISLNFTDANIRYILIRKKAFIIQLNVLGQYLSQIILIGIALLFVLKSRKIISLLLFSLSFMLIALFFTYSKGALISLIIALLFILYLKNKRILVLSLIAIIVAGFLLKSNLTSNFILGGFTYVFEDTSWGRIHAYDASLEIIAEKPYLLFVGGGFNTPKFLLQDYNQAHRLFSHTHNMYFESILGGGIIQLLILLAVWVLSIKVIWIVFRNSPNMFVSNFALGFLGSIIVFIINNFLHYFLTESIVTGHFWIFLAILNKIRMTSISPTNRGAIPSKIESRRSFYD